MKQEKGTVEIKRFIRKTSGGTHAWYEAEITKVDGTRAVIEVRKPIRPEDK